MHALTPRQDARNDVEGLSGGRRSDAVGMDPVHEIGGPDGERPLPIAIDSESSIRSRHCPLVPRLKNRRLSFQLPLSALGAIIEA